MAVKITKPQINVREKLEELNRKTGIAGEAMLSAETPQEQFSLINAGRRNLFINGDFNINQRNNYSSGIAGNVYITDRWKTYGNSQTMDATRSFVDFPDGTRGHTLTITSTGNTTGYIGLLQHVYDWSKYKGQRMTLSCWARTSIPTMNIYARNGNERTFIPSDGIWHKVSLTFDQLGASRDSDYSDTDIGFISFKTGSDPLKAGDFLQIGKVQLELGSIATPFEHRLKEEELRLARAYYEIPDSDSANQNAVNGTVFTNFNNGATWRTRIQFETPKKRIPSVSITSNLMKAYVRSSPNPIADGIQIISDNIYENGFRANFIASHSTDDSCYTNTWIWRADAEQ